MGKKDDRYYMSSVKIGPKGQIVIPKEARAMFGLERGTRWCCWQTPKRASPYRRRIS